MNFRMRSKTTLTGQRANLRDTKVRKEVYDALQEIADGMARDLKSNGLDQWFAHSNITFTTQVRIRGENAHAVVITDSDKFNWFNKGTDARWAVMNSPYEAQTTPGILGAGAGSRTYNKQGYYTRIRGRQAMQARNMPPQPGIAARGWTSIVVEMWRNKAAGILQRAVEKGLK